MPGETKPWVIVGTGAMACLFGALLSPHHRVTLLGTWAEGVRAVSRHGVKLETGAGVRTVEVAATQAAAELEGTELAVVLVKAWQTERAAAQLSACLTQGGLALSLQNGLGNLETLEQSLGRARATVGVVTVGATLLGPGHVRYGGQGVVYLGEDTRLKPLEAALRAAGLEVHTADDLPALMWRKLLINAGINPLTALLGVPNGGLLERPAAIQVLSAAVKEVAGVAAAKSIRLGLADPVEAALDVARKTAGNQSSMLQDVLRGAPTEIDAINGAVARQAEQAGVAAPVNWTLWQLVRARAAVEAA